ncbi:MAG: hypothetical protein Q8O05_07285 [Chloroflexota bacterium]|nr:hypothetical protein [Chloroflexota bacterium]
MKIMLRSELKALIDRPAGTSVSIYLPTHKTGPDTKQDMIRLKNLLRQAEEALVGLGLRRPEAIKFLSPVQGLLKDVFFWQRQSDGLAIFVSSDTFRYYRMPFSFAELAVASQQFYIKPLLAVFSGDGRYYVLALSQNQVRLLQCTRDGSRELDLPAAVPKSLAEALKFEEGEGRQFRYHAGAPGVGKEGLVFHGEGPGDIMKSGILRYFQQIDRGLRQEVLNDENAPLVLAAVDYLHAIYREANSYQHLFEEGLTGNPEELSPDELRKRAWTLVQPYFARAQAKAVADYHRFVGTGHTTTDVKEIVPKSYQGKVELLFAALNKQIWGTFTPGANGLELHDKPQPGDDDLLDIAAAYTLVHRGTVYAVKPEDMPDKGSLAAVLRYG